MGSTILVCGERFDIGHRVVTFEDDGGFNAYLPHRTDGSGEVFPSHPAPGLQHRVTRFRRRRSLGRQRKLSALRQVVRQIVVHLDGCRDAKMCFNVLHNQRGLSVHFLVDNDGTIYQTLDLLDCGFHAGGVNEISVGIELQNRGDAARYPNYYRTPRSTVTCRVHGVQFLAYDFTLRQYEAMERLCRSLGRILDVPLTSPTASNGELLWTLLDRPRDYRGLVGHYHLSRNKWDPGPWDFRRLLRQVGSRVSLPLTAPKPLSQQVRDPVKRTRQVERDAQSYFAANEQGDSGFFPVGPLGRSKLWHGGIHLPAAEGDAVYAPLQGQLRAARMASPCSLGSCNFVLIAHQFQASGRSIPFFSLFYHLQREGDQWGAGLAPWFARSQVAQRQLDRGDVAVFDDHIEAGELIGRVGEAGPAGARHPQIHFAIFAAEEFTEAIDPGAWELVEGGRASRFCRQRTILERIDRPAGGRPRDNLLSRRELSNFFRFSAKAADFRKVVVGHLAEWTPGDWYGELSRSTSFANLTQSARKRLIAEQITPTLWWTPRVAARTGLPTDGYVYSYHPIGFLIWYARWMVREGKKRSADIGSAASWEGKMAPTHLTADDEVSDAMADDEDHSGGIRQYKLTLQDLVKGYDQ